MEEDQTQVIQMELHWNVNQKKGEGISIHISRVLTIHEWNVSVYLVFHSAPTFLSNHAFPMSHFIRLFINLNGRSSRVSITCSQTVAKRWSVFNPLESGGWKQQHLLLSPPFLSHYFNKKKAEVEKRHVGRIILHLISLHSKGYISLLASKLLVRKGKS